MKLGDLHVTALIDMSEMLQQMAAESTGTAAPIHLQGETMATNEELSVVEMSTPGHRISIRTHGHDGMVDSWAECSCDWRGTTHRNVASSSVRSSGSYGARRDGGAHAAQFKAPEPEHSTTVKMVAGEHRSNYRPQCTCGWLGYHYGGDKPGRDSALAAATEHQAMFQAPEPKPAGTLNVGSIVGTFAIDPHLEAYAVKRAEWLQAVHDADVAQRALDVQRARAIEARRSMRRAEELADKAAAHRDEQYAAVDNLQGELLALVKGEQA